MAKVKTVKKIILRKGDVIDYQTVIEEVIGMEISKLSCYDNNSDNKRIIKGIDVEKDRAYFVPDCDYELIVRPCK